VEEDVVIQRVRVQGRKIFRCVFFKKGTQGNTLSFVPAVAVTLVTAGGAYPTTKENQHNTGNTVGAVLSSGPSGPLRKTVLNNTKIQLQPLDP
jgi:hypothetical protein